jgi:molybdopterin molybdotransferase
MITVEEAQARVTRGLRPLASELVSVSTAHGRVLANDVVARVTQPPAALSAMDGYAVRAADVTAAPVALRVVGYVPAGEHYRGGTLKAGEAVRIFTGAPIPAGADAIVIQEDADVNGDSVTVREGVPSGRYVRERGMDFSAGKTGLRAGRRLTARDVGLAAAMNVPWLSVRRRPFVAILATGDEVVMPGDPIRPNQIVSSNSHALAALVTACGAVPLNLGVALDTRESLSKMAEGLAGVDLLVTTGGASVGDHDLVRSVLGERGLELDFWKVAMRPGKPLMFGRIGDTPVLGLPGNPVSSFVCGLLFLRPMLEGLLGWKRDERALLRVRVACDLPANDERQDYLRARLYRDDSGDLRVEPFALQDSSVVSLLARADCLLVREPRAPAAARGMEVSVLTFDMEDSGF